MFSVCYYNLFTRQRNLKSPERISKIKPFIDIYSWKSNNFSPEEQDYKTFETNNKSIALNFLQVSENVNSPQKISHLYKSEFNKLREKKVILLMINDNEKQQYLAVKNLHALFF